MKEMGWTWQELMETPYEEYLKIKRILSIEAKKKQRETEKAKNAS